MITKLVYVDVLQLYVKFRNSLIASAMKIWLAMNKLGSAAIIGLTSVAKNCMSWPNQQLLKHFVLIVS